MKTRFGIAFVCICMVSALGTASPAQKGGAAPKLSGQYRAFPAVPQFGAAVGEVYVFGASGDVYRGWTGTQPTERFDFARAKTKEPEHTGKYAVAGDKITFRWNNKESETAVFSVRRDPKTGKTTTAIGPNFCYKIIPWNKPLQGTFEPSTYQGGFGDENKQSPPLVDSITFTADGRFTIMEDKAVSPLKGSYKISGATLALTLPSGKRTYSLHVFADHAQPPASVLIDGRPFFAKK